MPSYNPDYMTRNVVAKNIKLLCSEPTCQNNRSWTSNFCKKHQVQFSNHHRLGWKYVSPAMRKLETEQIRRLIELNPDHAGIQQGINFFAGTMKISYTHEIPYRKWWQFQADMEADPREFLVNTAAVYLVYREDEANRMIPTQRSLESHMGKEITRAPRDKSKIQRQVYRLWAAPYVFYNIGRYILKHLTILFINLSTAAINIEQAELDKKAELRAPLRLA